MVKFSGASKKKKKKFLHISQNIDGFRQNIDKAFRINKTHFWDLFFFFISHYLSKLYFGFNCNSHMICKYMMNMTCYTAHAVISLPSSSVLTQNNNCMLYSLTEISNQHDMHFNI